MLLRNLETLNPENGLGLVNVAGELRPKVWAFEPISPPNPKPLVALVVKDSNLSDHNRDIQGLLEGIYKCFFKGLGFKVKVA